MGSLWILCAMVDSDSTRIESSADRNGSRASPRLAVADLPLVTVYAQVGLAFAPPYPSILPRMCVWPSSQY